jgi:methylmalonyl-CoA mutase C-terminal domain/subunit
MDSVATSNASRVRSIPRVLLTKSFIDSHERAIQTIAKALRDASMEVILFEYEVPEAIARTAVDEDVDIIGISFMSGGQVAVTQQLMSLLREEGHGDLPVVVGGTIRPFDVDALEAAGVRRIFRGGEALHSVAEAFARLAAEYRAPR